MTQFIRLTQPIGTGRPILVNVAHITRLTPCLETRGTMVATDKDKRSFLVTEPFEVIEANLRLMAYITDMEATA